MADNWLPTLPQISRETLAVLAGALIVALVVSQSPTLKAWLHENWPGR